MGNRRNRHVERPSRSDLRLKLGVELVGSVGVGQYNPLRSAIFLGGKTFGIGRGGDEKISWTLFCVYIFVFIDTWNPNDP